jgi:hypothetical protein
MSEIFAWMLYLFLALFFIASGIEQGILWSRKGVDAFPWNEHRPIVVERIVLFILIVIGLYADTIEGLWILLSFIPSFWFWRDTAYYWTRHKIDDRVYPDWFTARSTTSSSVTIKAMSFEWRITLLCVSIIGLIINVIY